MLDKITKGSLREGFVRGVIEAALKDERVVVLSADVMSSTKVKFFEEVFPNRFFNVGVAEQALVTVASGMAAYGKIPIVAAYASFSPGRNWEQIRTTIALNNVPVIIMSTHAGLSCGADGSTNQILEDIALMRTLPNMRVFSPCDFNEAKKLAIQLIKNPAPSYVRLPREDAFDITDINTTFKIGKNPFLWDSMKSIKLKKVDATIVATGQMVYESILAAKVLEKEGIGSQVINAVNIKPFDTDILLKSTRLSGCVVSVEDHQIAGGLGSLVAETLSLGVPVPQCFVGVEDKYGESGTPLELYNKHGLTAKNIVAKVKEVIKRKNSL